MSANPSSCWNFYSPLIFRLDPALIRPGRVDVQVEIGFCSHDQVLRMFRSFYPGTDIKLAKQFADQVANYNLSAAHIQGFFLCNKDDPQGAIINCSDWLQILTDLGRSTS